MTTGIKTLLAFQITEKMMFIQKKKKEMKRNLQRTGEKKRTKIAIVIINMNGFRFLNEKSSQAKK